jgi:hypothetical protein
MNKDEILKEIRSLGSALMSISDAELIMGINIRSEIEYLNAYLAGFKETEYKTNKIVIEQAMLGSKPAQDKVFILIDEVNQKNG